MTIGQRILRNWDHAIAQMRKTPINDSRRSFWQWVCNAYAAEYARLFSPQFDHTEYNRSVEESS